MRQSAFVLELLIDPEYGVAMEEAKVAKSHICGDCQGQLFPVPKKDGGTFYRCEHVEPCGNAFIMDHRPRLLAIQLQDLDYREKFCIYLEASKFECDLSPPARDRSNAINGLAIELAKERSKETKCIPELAKSFLDIPEAVQEATGKVFKQNSHNDSDSGPSM